VNLSDFKHRTKRYVPQMGDVVYSREGSVLGIAAIIDKDCEVCLGQRLMIFVLNKSKVNNKFFWFVMNSAFVKKQVDYKIGGAAAPWINIKDVKKLILFLPPLELQNQFSKKVKKIEAQKEKFQQSLSELENNYNSLMQRVFKGELFS